MDLPLLEQNVYSTELLTRWFRIIGQLRLVGELISFLNDPQRHVLTVEQAQVTPLQPGYRIGEFTKSEVVVPRQEVQIVLVDELRAEEMRLLPRTEHLVVYTNTYAVSGRFHTGAETRTDDIFHVSPGPFFPASNAKVCSISPLNMSIEGETPVAFLSKEHLDLFHCLS
jgi:hypothetical protein